nr:serine/threonine/dual specificity protein kinase, catalytic domain-containing protein [Tanacetum cinerariifolium]
MIIKVESPSIDQQSIHKSDNGERNCSSSLLSLNKQCCVFSLGEIKFATHDFDDALVIGKGGFGNAEIEMLSMFRHSYIVSLLGYCEESGNREMILVYEYMSNGSPYDHLQKNRANGSNLSPLTWVQMLNICVVAARGLDYLHTGTSVQFRVIHHDVKSSNIFLNENLEAKISTLGYPELVLRISHALLLMFILVRPALDFTLDEQQHRLAGWAKHCIREGNIGRIIYSDLKGASLRVNCLKEFRQIAYACLCTCSKDRPTMTKVLVNLEFVLAWTLRSRQSTGEQKYIGRAILLRRHSRSGLKVQLHGLEFRHLILVLLLPSPKVTGGLDCSFSQDVVAMNNIEKHCCNIGEVNKRAIITPDIDSILENLKDL